MVSSFYFRPLLTATAPTCRCARPARCWRWPTTQRSSTPGTVCQLSHQSIVILKSDNMSDELFGGFGLLIFDFCDVFDDNWDVIDERSLESSRRISRPLCRRSSSCSPWGGGGRGVLMGSIIIIITVIITIIMTIIKATLTSPARITIQE